MRTIGKYYKKTVLSIPEENRRKVELPVNWDNSKIEQDLFGWKLYSGKEYVECRSEEEARFLKVFLDSDVREVYVPNDDNYLKEILPPLENIKTKSDETTEDFLYGVVNRQLKARIRHEVFMEITK